MDGGLIPRATAPDVIRRRLPASRRLGPDGPLVLGILNVTPDSFSDGGLHDGVEAAVAHARRLWDEGADLLDVGGESTRPGAAPVPPEEEARRVLPVLRALREALPDAPVSIDTRRARVAAAAVEAGAAWVNDVSGGGDPDMATVVAEAGVPWVLMHLRGTPRTMQDDTAYDDLVGAVEAGLRAAVDRAVAAGAAPERLIVDPGLGFGKAPRDNPRLVAATGRLRHALDAPILIGASRKRFVGELTDVADPAARVHGSVGVALAAMAHGVDVLRVHDVGPTIQAARTWRACSDG